MKRKIRNIQEIKGAEYQKYDTTTGGYKTNVEEVDDNIFFKIIKRIVLETDWKLIHSHSEPDYIHDRDSLIEKFTKLYGFNSLDFTENADGIQHAIYWAVYDNYDKIVDGRVNNFNELKLRPTQTYNVHMHSHETEYVEYKWVIPKIKGYSKDDIERSVQMNEDGLYDWWEYETNPGFYRDVYDNGDRDEWGVESMEEVGTDSNPINENWWEEETTDKWGLLEKDMREAMDKIIEDHTPNWGGDQYNVMGAIEDIMEGLFQKVQIRESFMSDPKVAKYFENKDILKYLKGKDRELISDAVEMLRGWGRYNPAMTDLSPFLTDATENLKGEYAADILKWATENDSFPPDYNQFFEELDREEVTWLWENGQDVRDALTRSAILLAEDTDGGESMDVLNKIFKEFARKTYKFILTGEWLENAQQRRNSEPMTDEDTMEGIMMDTPDNLMEQYKDDENGKMWTSDYADVETDNREDYLTQVLERFYGDVIYDENKWERDGHNDDLLFLLTQESQNMIEDLEMNQEHKTADKIEKILSPLWDFDDERRDILDKHRKILISTIQGIKDFVKIYGIGPDRFSNKNYR